MSVNGYANRGSRIDYPVLSQVFFVKTRRVLMKEEQYVVYKITCKVNGKVYIGQTNKSIQERLSKHFSFAFSEQERSKNVKFSRAIRKYGKDNFYIVEIDRATSQSELDEKEIYWITQYNSVEQGYNSRDTKGKCGGDTLSHHWNKAEISRKISEKMKGDLNPMKTHSYLVSGERNGMFGKHGKDHHNSLKCVAINSITGEVVTFDSQVDAAKYVGMKSSSGVTERIKGNTKSEFKGWQFYSYEEYLKSQETIERVDDEKYIIE